MADDADATEIYYAMEARDRELRVAAALKTKVEATGVCLNCEAELDEGQLYCNAECSKEHDWYLQRRSACA